MPEVAEVADQVGTVVAAVPTQDALGAHLVAAGELAQGLGA